MDPRILKLADTLINFSCRLKKGENVLIQARNEDGDFVKALVREAYKAGANPNIDYSIEKIDKVNEFLCQDTDSRYSLEEEIGMLESIFAEESD